MFEELNVFPKSRERMPELAKGGRARHHGHQGEEGGDRSSGGRNIPSPELDSLPKLGTGGKLSLFQSCLSAQSCYCAVGGTDSANPTKSISLDTSCKVSAATGAKTPTWSSFVKECCHSAPFLLGAHAGGENFSSGALGLSAHGLVRREENMGEMKLSEGNSQLV